MKAARVILFDLMIKYGVAPVLIKNLKFEIMHLKAFIK